MPSSDVDAECDVWCRKLAKNLTGEIFPPEQLRPWILARIAVAKSACDCEQLAGKTFPFPALSPAFFEKILVDEWNAALREDWWNHWDHGDQSSLSG
jgi:hypothetical protein